MRVGASPLPYALRCQSMWALFAKSPRFPAADRLHTGRCEAPSAQRFSSCMITGHGGGGGPVWGWEQQHSAHGCFYTSRPTRRLTRTRARALDPASQGMQTNNARLDGMLPHLRAARGDLHVSHRTDGRRDHILKVSLVRCPPASFARLGSLAVSSHGLPVTIRSFQPPQPSPLRPPRP